MHKNIIKKALLSLGIVSAFSVTFLSVNATGNTLSVTGYDEGIKGNVSFGGNTTEINSVKYQAIGSSTWTDLNSELIRGDGTSYRFDILGLTPGKYNVKVNATVDGESYEEVCNNITVTSDDRSGYAHFNYTDGVGAYNDDGTLKDNAVVVYVTDDNKNTVSATIGEKTYTGLANILSNASSSYPLDIRIIGAVKTTQWNKVTYTSSAKSSALFTEQNESIGNLYSSKSKIYAETLIDNGSNSYSNDLANGITTLNGLTSYISCGDGKNEFDTYWNMMDVKNTSNITIEGVGDDASIFQWGFTFSRCNSIEVKNLAFDDYTEDAIGIQGGSNDDMNYSNFWIHNCTFEQGVNNWDLSYEQDKGDGDGSTDFKYAHNLTISYCRYNETHKTNLIGANNAALQYNITLHHNYYLNCKARLPLVRQANTHMYNNYYSGTTSTGISARAHAYAFVENCYFDGKNPFMLAYEVKNEVDPVGTTIKAIGNEFSSSTSTSNSSSNGVGYKENGIYVLTSTTPETSIETSIKRTTASVGSVCTPDGSTSYANFDTNSELFYYDSTNNISDVKRLDDASDLPTIIPTIAGAGITESKNPSEEVSNYTLQVSGNTGSYTENETTYYAYRAIGKLSGVSEEEISNAVINATVYGESKSGNTYEYPYEITTVYKQLTSNGEVLSGCEMADNTWYFYFIIKDITSSYNGYSFKIKFDVTIGSEKITKTSDEYTISISDSTNSYMITFDSLETNTDGISTSVSNSECTIYGEGTKIQTCDVTINGNTFTKYVSLSGSTESTSAKNIEFVVSNITTSATVRVYYYVKANRTVKLFDDNGNTVTDGTYTPSVDETSYKDFTITSDGTYHVGSASNGIYIYAIEIIYN